jgi:uncharacterized protein
MQPNFDIVTKQLKTVLNPTRIYLFGSYAVGADRPESDIDLLIVVPDDDERCIEKTRKAYKALRGLGVAKDIIVDHESTFHRKAAWLSSIEHEVVKTGKLLYAA